MALPIIGADERLAQRKGIKGVIFGRSGIGKTSLLWTLNASTTLFLDLEAGDLAVEGLEIDTLRPRTWKECRDFAVFIGGPNPALREDQPYSQAHFDEVCGRYGDPAVIEKYETVFIDSITVAGRLCFQWCRGQPEAFSEKTGKPDIRGAYGLHGREMIGWLTHLQHARVRPRRRRSAELGAVRGDRPCACAPARRPSSSAALLRSLPAATRWAWRPPVRARPSCCRRSPAK
ncbi:hypothetical protein ABIE69_001579 [Rhodobacteraceae bacterium MBR-64]|jgi:hypothetical protein